jgi:hypothetical protein
MTFWILHEASCASAASRNTCTMNHLYNFQERERITCQRSQKNYCVIFQVALKQNHVKQDQPVLSVAFVKNWLAPWTVLIPETFTYCNFLSFLSIF